MLDLEIVGDKDLARYQSTAGMREAHTTPLQLSPSHSSRRRRDLLSLVVIIPALVALVGHQDWRPQQPGADRLRADIWSAVRLEAWAWKIGDEALADSLLDPQAPESWVQQVRRQQQRRYINGDFPNPIETVRHVELRGDLALVEVFVTQPGPAGATVHRETRFYRHVGRRWLRTPPVSEFWGAPRVTETDHLSTASSS